MATNIASLRNARQQALTRLSEQTKKEESKTGSQDEQFWKHTFDPKTKIGTAVIRFLETPVQDGEDAMPWVRVWSHSFQGPTGTWYFENCPTTLDGRACPVCKANKVLWTGTEADKKIVSIRKRKLSFISNILVINDPAHPENNSLVKLYKYGTKIHDMLKDMYEPELPEQTPVNPFSFWEGADFKLRSHDDSGYLNYSKSVFAAQSELFAGDDEKKDELWRKEYSLKAFIAEDQFKAYEVLEARFEAALSGKETKSAAAKVKNEQDADVEQLTQKIQQTEAKAEQKKPVPTMAERAKAKATAKPESSPTTVDGDEADEDIHKFFSKLQTE